MSKTPFYGCRVTDNVIPMKMGIQEKEYCLLSELDSRFRGNDSSDIKSLSKT